MDTFLATLFLIVCVLLIIVVLLQRGRGGGLGGAFGGAGHSAFGTRTGDVFTWVTIVLVGVFLLLSIGAQLRFRPARQEPVDAPTFYPPAQAIAEGIHVSISCDTPGAEIFFTTGSQAKPLAEPTRGSVEYDAPVWIQPGTILKARAFLRGWEPSKVVVGAYPLVTATQPSPPTGETQPANATKPPPATSPGQ